MLPKPKMALGLVFSMSWVTDGRQHSISVWVGSLLPGGRVLTMLFQRSFDNHSSGIRIRSTRPALPTNCLPLRSSSAPGPSPIRYTIGCLDPVGCMSGCKLPGILYSGQTWQPCLWRNSRERPFGRIESVFCERPTNPMVASSIYLLVGDYPKAMRGPRWVPIVNSPAPFW